MQQQVQDHDVAGLKPLYPGTWRLALIWSVIGLLSAARGHGFAASRGGLAMVALYLGCVVWFAPWIVITQGVFRLESTHPLGGRGWGRSLATLAAWSVLACAVAAPLMVYACLGLFGVMDEWPWGPPRGGPGWIHPFTSALMCYWSSVAAGYFLRTLSQLREQEQRAARLAVEKAQLEASLNQAKLEALQARLNPHFLFNSLQNISVLTRQDAATAGRMLTRLGDVLRAVLRLDARPEWTVREEIELTRSYVALEQMRFGDRLVVDFEVDADLEGVLVPSFLLQPLVENSITHGLRGAGRKGRIEIAMQREGARMVVTVSDDGVGVAGSDLSELKLGVGLGSTGERLKRMYGERHEFGIARRAKGGTEVRIALPLEQEESRHAGTDR